MLLCVHVTNVLFLVRFNNFTLTMGFYWSYTLLLYLPVLMRFWGMKLLWYRICLQMIPLIKVWIKKLFWYKETKILSITCLQHCCGMCVPSWSKLELTLRTFATLLFISARRRYPSIPCYLDQNLQGYHSSSPVGLFPLLST